MSFVDDVDYIVKETGRRLAQNVIRMRKEIPHPALSHKLTSKELWEKYGADYATMRDDPQAMQMTLDQMGEKDAVEFSHDMEKAMEEHYGQTDRPL